MVDNEILATEYGADLKKQFRYVLQDTITKPN